MIRPVTWLFSLALCLAACAPRHAQVSPCERTADNHSHDDDAATHDHGTPSAKSAGTAARPAVIPHAGLAAFTNNGNTLTGLATRSHGAQTFEVWRSSVLPGGATPLHTHETEEVFVVLSGKGEVQVGDEIIPFAAPATVIAPAGVPHQLRNTGTEPTEQIVVVGIGSIIFDHEGEPMNLPWRK